VIFLAENARDIAFHSNCTYLTLGNANKQNFSYKSAASFCYQVAAWVLDIFCKLYSAKNQDITNNSAGKQ
jgi:hypothetical protein